MAFRPRVSPFVVWLGTLLIFAPLTIVLAACLLDGALWTWRIAGSTTLGALFGLVAVGFVGSVDVLAVLNALELVAQGLRPLRLRDKGEVLCVRPGGFWHGRLELRIAKVDLTEVLLKSHSKASSATCGCCTVHGMAFRLATDVLDSTAEQRGLRSWLGTRREAADDYRTSAR